MYTRDIHTGASSSDQNAHSKSTQSYIYIYIHVCCIHTGTRRRNQTTYLHSKSTPSYIHLSMHTRDIHKGTSRNNQNTHCTVHPWLFWYLFCMTLYGLVWSASHKITARYKYVYIYIYIYVHLCEVCEVALLILILFDEIPSILIGITLNK